MTAEWLPWGGGECPVDPYTKVLIKLRYEPETYGSWDAPVCAYLLRWEWLDNAGDIVEYRVAE